MTGNGRGKTRGVESVTYNTGLYWLSEERKEPRKVTSLVARWQTLRNGKVQVIAEEGTVK